LGVTRRSARPSSFERTDTSGETRRPLIGKSMTIHYSLATTLLLLDLAGADTSAAEAVKESDSIAGADVVVAIEEHVIQMDELGHDGGLLLRSDILVDELDIEQIAVREHLPGSLGHVLGFELGDLGVVLKVDRLGVLVGRCRSVLELRVAAELQASTEAGGSLGGGKLLGSSLGVVGVGAFHRLHEGLDATTKRRLDGLAQELGALPTSLEGSWLAADIARVEGGLFTAALGASKAAQAGLGAGAAAVASLPLHGHKWRGSRVEAPVDLLAGDELGGVLVHEVELDKDGMPGGTHAPGAIVRFLFDDHDALVRRAIEDIVHVRLFPTTLCHGFNQAEPLLEKERVGPRKELDDFFV